MYVPDISFDIFLHKNTCTVLLFLRPSIFWCNSATAWSQAHDMKGGGQVNLTLLFNFTLTFQQSLLHPYENNGWLLIFTANVSFIPSSSS